MFSQVEALENVTTLIGRMSTPYGCYQSNWGNLNQLGRCSCLCAIEHGPTGIDQCVQQVQSSCFKCGLVRHFINYISPLVRSAVTLVLLGMLPSH